MRYRRLGYRYAIVVRSAQIPPVGDVWQSERLRLLTQPRWRPDADAYETPKTLEILVDLAGVEEDDFEVQLFEDVVVVEGHRRPPACQEGAVYQAAGIRQGPFQVVMPLWKSIDSERVDARYERGLLRISLPKRAGVR